MTIRPEFLAEPLHEAAIRQLISDYTAKGYSVAREVRIDNYHADLVATKNDLKIVFEVKTRALRGNEKKKIEKISKFVNSQKNYQFKVVVAAPPTRKDIQFNGLEEAIHSYLINNFPNELNQLSSATTLDDITGIVVHSIEVLPTGRLHIKGLGEGEIELFTNDVDISFNDTYPFDFDLVVEVKNGKAEIIEVNNLQFDVSSYYE